MWTALAKRLHLSSPAWQHADLLRPWIVGLRFYHTHVRAGADLAAGQDSGLVGPVYIEPKENPGRYDREVFLTMKEFQPTLSRGGDMAMNFLSPAQTVPVLKDAGETSMKASLAKGMPHGHEVGYDSFTINGKMLGHGEPIRVKQGERVLFHVLNGSAGEIRSLALPGHTLTIVALDGNPLPKPVRVPGLWRGTAERISAIVELNHPGVWVMGDLSDDDRKHGMGIVVEYAGYEGKPQWIAPKPFKWNYAHFGNAAAAVAQPDETFDMLLAKQNAATDGFNQWTVNGLSYPIRSENNVGIDLTSEFTSRTTAVPAKRWACQVFANFRMIRVRKSLLTFSPISGLVNILVQIVPWTRF
jgi:FtsP/CotA-like multicopper oxidase with cupredoxin domain